LSQWKPLNPPIAEYLECSRAEEESLLAEIAEILYKLAYQFEKESEGRRNTTNIEARDSSFPIQNKAVL
jgi:hypothetical protein